MHFRTYKNTDLTVSEVGFGLWTISTGWWGQFTEGEAIVLQDVFVFEQTGYVEGKVQGRLRPTGIRPKFSEKFEAAGIKLPQGVFGDMNVGLR